MAVTVTLAATLSLLGPRVRPSRHRAAVASSSATGELRGLLQMARLKNVPMGAALVAFGAYGARHAPPRPPTMVASQLALGVATTTIVTTGSMLINDYIDISSRRPRRVHVRHLARDRSRSPRSPSRLEMKESRRRRRFQLAPRLAKVSTA